MINHYKIQVLGRVGLYKKLASAFEGLQYFKAITIFLLDQVKIIKISKFKEESQMPFWGQKVWEYIIHMFSFIHKK